MYVFWQQVQCFYCQQQVLPTFDSTYVQHKTGRQSVAFSYLGFPFCCYHGGKPWRKTLVDDADAVSIFCSAQFDDVLFGTFTDGNDVFCLAQCLAKFPFVDFRVYPVVVFGMSEEDKVVDGDYSVDAGFAQTDRQFTGHTMIHADTVAF